jgi:hypothetical protein
MIFVNSGVSIDFQMGMSALIFIYLLLIDPDLSGPLALTDADMHCVTVTSLSRLFSIKFEMSTINLRPLG